jgi:hypothetical protein
MRQVLVPLWLVVSILAGTPAVAMPKPKPNAARTTAIVPFEQQLADQITYPKSLGNSDLGRIVVIRFRVNADNRLNQLEVFSNNTDLNHELTRQLTDRKRYPAGPDLYRPATFCSEPRLTRRFVWPSPTSLPLKPKKP